MYLELESGVALGGEWANTLFFQPFSGQY